MGAVDLKKGKRDAVVVGKRERQWARRRMKMSLERVSTIKERPTKAK